MGYLPILFVMALIMAVAAGTALFFSWKILQNKTLSGRQLWLALVSGFIFWFLLSVILILVSPVWVSIAMRWFGGNGFSLSFIAGMAGILLHHQLLSLLTKK